MIIALWIFTLKLIYLLIESFTFFLVITFSLKPLGLLGRLDLK